MTNLLNPVKRPLTGLRIFLKQPKAIIPLPSTTTATVSFHVNPHLSNPSYIHLAPLEVVLSYTTTSRWSIQHTTIPHFHTRLSTAHSCSPFLHASTTQSPAAREHSYLLVSYTPIYYTELSPFPSRSHLLLLLKVRCPPTGARIYSHRLCTGSTSLAGGVAFLVLYDIQGAMPNRFQLFGYALSAATPVQW